MCTLYDDLVPRKLHDVECITLKEDKLPSRNWFDMTWFDDTESPRWHVDDDYDMYREINTMGEVGSPSNIGGVPDEQMILDSVLAPMDESAPYDVFYVIGDEEPRGNVATMKAIHREQRERMRDLA